jgi:hypothetical protein
MGEPGVSLPAAFARKYPNAATEIRKMFAKRCDDSRRQDRYPILTALGVANDHFTAFENEILDAKSMRLHQPQPASIEQIRDQPGRTIKLSQHRTHFSRTQYHRTPLRPTRSGNVREPRQLDVEHLPVKKQQSLERLILGGRPDPGLDRAPPRTSHAPRAYNQPRSATRHHRNLTPRKSGRCQNVQRTMYRLRRNSSADFVCESFV